MKNYSKEVDNKYGFELALKWYLESNSLRPVIMNFINATTSFERLMNKFHQLVKTEPTFCDKSTLDELDNALKKCASSFLESNGITSEEIKQKVYCKISDLKNPSYSDKAKKLLEYWGIDYSDIDPPLDKIGKVRNPITHVGEYIQTESGEELKVLMAWRSLFTIRFIGGKKLIQMMVSSDLLSFWF